jgi:hypothetical protein
MVIYLKIFQIKINVMIYQFFIHLQHFAAARVILFIIKSLRNFNRF